MSPSLSSQQISFDSDRGRGRFGKTPVADPFEIELAALGRDREEGNERVCGDGWKQVGAEDLRAVVAASKTGDDIARDGLASGGVAIAGFHDMRHQRLDLDDIATLCFFRN